MLESKEDVLLGTESDKALHMAGMADAVGVGVVVAGVPKCHGHHYGIVFAVVFAAVDESATKGSGKEGVFNREVVFPATAKDDQVLGFVDEKMCKSVDIGKASYQCSFSIAATEYGYGASGGAVCHSFAVYVA